MSWRRLRVIIQHLPPESHTMTALRNGLTEEQLEEHADQGEPEHGRWSQLEQLLALQIDVQRQQLYAFTCANTDSKSKRPQAPEPIARPGAKPRKPKPKLTDNSREALFRLINGGAA